MESHNQTPNGLTKKTFSTCTLKIFEGPQSSRPKNDWVCLRMAPPNPISFSLLNGNLGVYGIHNFQAHPGLVETLPQQSPDAGNPKGSKRIIPSWIPCSVRFGSVNGRNGPRQINRLQNILYQDWLLAYSEKLLETFCFRQFLLKKYNPALEEVPQTLPLAKLGGTSHSREDSKSASGNLGKNQGMGPVNNT